MKKAESEILEEEQVSLKNHIYSEKELNKCQSLKEEGTCKKGVVSFKEAPHYLKFNPYITGGYRDSLDLGTCCKSLFWWTNETLNIWTHLLGWVAFLVIYYLNSGEETTIRNAGSLLAPFISNSFILFCFQACMLLSALYHIFCCQSECSYKNWLTLDLLGVCISLLVIYLSGIYYAFECRETHLKFYLTTVIAMFVFALMMEILPLKTTEDGFQWRLWLFGGWAGYGLIPTMHWVILEGFQSEVVQVLLPKIIMMYVIAAFAFGFYVTRFPERAFPGAVNYIGGSHQIWHVLIFCALLHWYYTGIFYEEYTKDKDICNMTLVA